MIYLVLGIPLFLSGLSLVLNKKYWKLVLFLNVLFYFFLSVLILYFFFAGYTFKSSIFYLNFFLDFVSFKNINTLFVALILLLAFLISYYAYFYFQKEKSHKVIGNFRLKEYNIFVNLFILAMLLVATTNNILIMWIGLEATTIFTTFLISFYNTKSSWEAAWKYVILCSVGLTLGLFGIILLIKGGLDSVNYLNISYASVNPLLVKIAFIFIVVGFGTKVGLFPMNSWLPDAHGKASTPVSAFMSSILLPLALYLIFRIKVIVDTILHNSTFTDTTLLVFGLSTLIYSGFIMLKQKHFKRMLAYSSTENMGIITIALGISSPLSLKLGILHLIAHSFLKSSSFMSVGNVLLEQKTGQFDKISDLLKKQKLTSILMIVSLAMLVGIPLSPLFISELGLIYSLFLKNIYLSLVFVFSLILVFSGFVINFSKLFVYEKDSKVNQVDEKFRVNSIFLPISVTLVLGIISIFSILFIF